MKTLIERKILNILTLTYVTITTNGEVIAYRLFVVITIDFFLVGI